MVMAAMQPCLAADDEPTSAIVGLVMRGEDVLSKSCARCHAMGVSDQSAHAQAPPFRDIVTRYPVEALAEALAEGILSGHPDMPVIAFDSDDVSAILAYLQDLKSKPASR